VASDPRLVKEADTLVAAGYRVHVIAGRHFAPADQLDHDILATARWSYTVVGYRNSGPAIARKMLRRVARYFITRVATPSVALAARAHHAESIHLGAIAEKSKADLYIAHCLAALPAAALAASNVSSIYGFDAEDFHDGETADIDTDSAERTARATLHRCLLPGCTYFSAASPLIAEAYAQAYGVEVPITLLNVFPLKHRPEAPIEPMPITADRPARCYWFSQTIGPGRGLEFALAMFARMRTPVEIHLRGFTSPDYERRLHDLATQHGLRRPIIFHRSGSPDEMSRLAATADLGLSLEERYPRNRDICLTNKIFVYLLAGIPQLLSNTAAQSAFAPELGPAALLGDLNDPNTVAVLVDAFFSDLCQVRRARQAAWKLAEERFCWEREQVKFLNAVQLAFDCRAAS
jgi:hypothetical protein